MFLSTAAPPFKLQKLFDLLDPENIDFPNKSLGVPHHKILLAF